MENQPPKINRKYFRSIAVFFVVALLIVGFLSVKVAPYRTEDGIAWFEGGYHSLSNDQVNEQIEQINAPAENKISESVDVSTSSCDNVANGFCKQSSGIFVDKELVSAAVDYVPATPDTKLVTGYCTLCNDGTFSPSCAVGRGACSHHGGVNAYGVAEYRIIPGKPAVQAQPAVYSYTPETYRDSPDYVKPADPSLNAIAGY